MSVRAFSHGGGIQSTAALVLASRGEIDFPLFIYANPGMRTEPATLDYVRNVATPYAEAHGIELVERQKTLRTGKPDDLEDMVERRKSSIPIPVKMGPGGSPGNRTCTGDFKIKVVDKEVKARGATEKTPATIGIGISLDEYSRAQSAYDERYPFRLREYPFIDLRITRAQCHEIIRSEGLPTPPKSACYFCPFHKDEDWRTMAREDPESFEAACQMEEKLYERGKALGRGDFFFTRHGALLRDLFAGNTMTLDLEYDDDQERCGTGHCFT